MGGLSGSHALDELLGHLPHPVDEGAELLHQGLCVGLLGQLLRLLLHEEAAGLVGQRRRGIALHPGLRQERQLGVDGLPDLPGRLLGLFRVEAVQGVLAVLAVFAHAHHHAPLGGHGLAAHRPGVPGDADGQALGVGGQDAHIVIVRLQQPEQLLQARFDPAQISGKGCFHRQIPPFFAIACIPYFCIIARPGSFVKPKAPGWEKAGCRFREAQDGSGGRIILAAGADLIYNSLIIHARKACERMGLP